MQNYFTNRKRELKGNYIYRYANKICLNIPVLNDLYGVSWTFVDEKNFYFIFCDCNVFLYGQTIPSLNK